MAAESPVGSLQEEATCPICLDYFREPVILDCGHNFCRACVSQCWEGSHTDVSCPQCRETMQQRNLRLNRQLVNVVEIAKKLSFQASAGADREKMCAEHQEALKLFCEEDQAPICVVCDRSPAHRAHMVVPIEEAAQKYKEKIQAHLKILKKEREKLLGLEMTGDKRSQKYLKQTQNERQKIVSEFQQLQQFLQEQERHLLAQLETLDTEIVRIQGDNVTKLSAQISRLSDLISEMERSCQKPASDFLQDIRNTLSRCEKGTFQQPEEISPELEKGLSDISEKAIAFMETLKKFKDTLPSALERTRGKSLRSFTPVTLDPDTAHPQLLLSEDGKSVRWAKRQQDLLYNPERFNTLYCVLGCEGFTSGKHCWEVEVKVGNGGYWAVGVARESVRRKGGIRITPEEGIWAVGWWGGDLLQALTAQRTPLPQSLDPSKIRVCLDCQQGQVTFFTAGDEAPVFSFPPGSVPGERIRPWFGIWNRDTRLQLYS